jgi:hypothetical protein
MPRKSRAIKTSDLKGGKPWLRKAGIHQYAVNSRTRNKTFLIVCEGQTEEFYFNSFPVLTATVRSVRTGSSKTALVEAVEPYRRTGSYDEIWCVFDYDHDPLTKGQSEDFNRAIQLAGNKGYHCAYSNDCFELWFVLHYQYVDQKLLREYFCEMLGLHWKLNYEKEGKRLAFARTIYRLLVEDPKASQQQAIERAHKLLMMHEGKPFHLQNPITTVFQLVEQLNLHCRK